MAVDEERGRISGDGVRVLAEQSRAARTAIIQAKLRPPVRSARLVDRPRLHRLLDEAVRGPLTLVVAPAGSGKTSLLAGWVRETPLRSAWLSLDETDRDPVQLWRGLLAALESLAPGCATRVAPMLRRPTTLQDAVSTLLDELEEREADDAAVVVDDLQLVDDDEQVNASLALFVQHLPEWLHVVVASRRTPRFPVHRLRARGELGELRFAELRFSQDEAAAVLKGLAPDLDADRIQEVAARAGGWAASIQLAALAARSARARSRVVPVGSEGERRMLEDYVWREVLAGEDAGVIDVLLATSVVERVEPGLARILASRPDADDLLVRAGERGLFVSRAEQDGSFEVHALVREVLEGLLERRDPERPVQLHTWAAGWHQAHGRTVAALDHWLRAGRPREALRLLFADLAPLAEGGHLSTISRVVGSIPPEVVVHDTEAAVELAWCHLPVDRRGFLRQTARLVAATHDEPDAPSGTTARVGVLESIASLHVGDWDRAALRARSAMGALGEAWWLDTVGRYAWNHVARCAALGEEWGAEQEPDGVLLKEPAARHLVLDGPRALGAALAGLPEDALRFVGGTQRRTGDDADEVVELGTERQVELGTASGDELALARAIALREVGQTVEAVRSLVELVEQGSGPAPYCPLLAGLELTLARVDDGGLAAAEQAFRASSELVETEMPGPAARSRLARTGVVLATALDDEPAARAWAAQVDDRFWSPVSAARIALAAGEPGPAFDALKDAEPRCVRHRVVAGLLRSRTCTDRTYAEQCLGDAVRLAARHGLVQSVAAELGGTMGPVELLAWQLPIPWLARLRRTVVVDAPGRRPRLAPAEALTGRELEVLRMLPSRLTLREIADELYISINTLKFHLKVVYRKLDCASRAEAAAAARDMTRLRPRD